ncbi:MAG: hypothetical protein HYW49_00195 [Deltaproteobacteria bacterium]|nr:hypothetical protein [Deltaproteobacteria bacterium]
MRKKSIIFFAALSVVATSYLWKKVDHSTRVEFQYNNISKTEASKPKQNSYQGPAHIPSEHPKTTDEISPAVNPTLPSIQSAHSSLVRSKFNPSRQMKSEDEVTLPAEGEIIPDNFPLRRIPVGAVLEVLKSIAIPACRISLLYDFEGVHKAYKAPPSGECTASDLGFHRIRRWYDKPYCELVVNPQRDSTVIEKGRLLPVAHTLGPEENGFGIYLGIENDPTVRMIRCTGGTDSADVALTTEDLLRAFNRRFQIKMPPQRGEPL